MIVHPLRKEIKTRNRKRYHGNVICILIGKYIALGIKPRFHDSDNGAIEP